MTGSNMRINWCARSCVKVALCVALVVAAVAVAAMSAQSWSQLRAATGRARWAEDAVLDFESAAERSRRDKRCAACAKMKFEHLLRWEFPPLSQNGASQSDTTQSTAGVTAIVCINRKALYYPIQMDSLVRQGATTVLYAFSKITRARWNGKRQDVRPHWCCPLALCLEACNSARERKIVFLDADTLANLSYVTSQFAGKVVDRVISVEEEDLSARSASERRPAALQSAELAPILVNSVPRETWDSRWSGQVERDVIKVQTNLVAIRSTQAALDALQWWLSLDITQVYAEQGALHLYEPVGGCGVPGKVSCLANRDNQRYHCFGLKGHSHARNKSECMARFRGRQFYFDQLGVSLSDNDVDVIARKYPLPPAPFLAP